MNNAKGNGQKGKWKWWLACLWWVVGLSVPVATVAWTHLSSGEPRSGVIAILSLVVVIAVWYEKLPVEKLRTCLRKSKNFLKKSWLKVKKSWFLSNPWGVGVAVFVAGALVWSSLLLIGLPLIAYCPGLLMIAVLARWAMVFTYQRGKQNGDQDPENRFRKRLSVIDSWLVGLVVFIVGFVSWTYLVPFLAAVLQQSNGENLWKVHWEANEWGDYSQGLVLLALAGLTAGFTYWRGQQTREQIEKAQRQIEETQRQADIAQKQVEETHRQADMVQRQADIAQKQFEETRRQIKKTQRRDRHQNFDKIIQMALDNENSMRALTGWKQIQMLFARQTDFEDLGSREDREDWETFLEVTRRAARSVLTLKPETRKSLWLELARYRRLHRKWYLSWNNVRATYFVKTDEARFDRDIRQQAIKFLVTHPEQKGARGQVYVPDCDLSDLHLKGHWVRGSGGKLFINAIRSYCVEMTVDQDIDISGSQFVEATIMGAYLRKVNLSKADLSFASLQYTNLHGSNLEEATLINTDLRKARLAGLVTWQWHKIYARFHKTRIDGADFTSAEGVLNLIKLLQGCYWERGDKYGGPYLPGGVDESIIPVIPSAPERTKPTGGDDWEKDGMDSQDA